MPAEMSCPALCIRISVKESRINASLHMDTLRVLQNRSPANGFEKIHWRTTHSLPRVCTSYRHTAFCALSNPPPTLCALLETIYRYNQKSRPHISALHKLSLTQLNRHTPSPHCTFLGDAYSRSYEEALGNWQKTRL